MLREWTPEDGEVPETRSLRPWTPEDGEVPVPGVAARKFDPSDPVDAYAQELIARKVKAEGLVDVPRPGPTVEAAENLKRTGIIDSAAKNEATAKSAERMLSDKELFSGPGFIDPESWKEQHKGTAALASGGAQILSGFGDFLWAQAAEAQRKNDEAAQVGKSPLEGTAGDQLSGFSALAYTMQEGIRRLMPEDEKGRAQRTKWAADLSEAAERLRPFLGSKSATDAVKDGQFLQWAVVQGLQQAPQFSAQLAAILVPELAVFTLPALMSVAAGGQYTEDIKAKVEHDAAYADSLANGIFEGLGEAFGLGVGRVGAKAMRRIVSAIPIAQREAAAAALLGRAAHALAIETGTRAAEGASEVFTQVGQDISQEAITGRSAGDKFENAITAGAIGAIATPGAIIPGHALPPPSRGQIVSGLIDEIVKGGQWTTTSAEAADSISEAESRGRNPVTPGKTITEHLAAITSAKTVDEAVAAAAEGLDPAAPSVVPPVETPPILPPPAIPPEGGAPVATPEPATGPVEALAEAPLAVGPSEGEIAQPAPAAPAATTSGAQPETQPNVVIAGKDLGPVDAMTDEHLQTASNLARSPGTREAIAVEQTRRAGTTEAPLVAPPSTRPLQAPRASAAGRAGPSQAPELRTDNPGGSWLAHEQRLSAEAGDDARGVPKRMGSVTGYYDSRAATRIPVSVLANIPGMRGEQQNVRSADLDSLKKVMGETGKLPLFNGREHLPFITVDYRGRPFVSEGNHRIMAAAALGMKDLPVQIQYHAGGEEQQQGILSPDKVAAFSAETSDANAPQTSGARADEPLASTAVAMRLVEGSSQVQALRDRAEAIQNEMDDLADLEEVDGEPLSPEQEKRLEALTKESKGIQKKLEGVIVATRLTPSEGKPQTAKEIAAKALPHLTEPEAAKLRTDTARALVEIFDILPSSAEMAHVALAGKSKRGWYRQSAHAIAQVFGPDGPRFAYLLASTSARTSVESNLLNALNIWSNWQKAGRPTSRGEIVKIMGESVQGQKGIDSILNAWENNAVAALSTPDEELHSLVLSGPKVNSFYSNLIGNVEEVTSDAWMAAYAGVDQAIFEGKLTKGGDPGKGAGYLAMNARIRHAAKIASKMTGETWTPAEIQETIWSWAKTVYELARSKGGLNAAVEAVRGGEVNDDLIRETVDFRSLFNESTYQKILTDAGYGEKLAALRAERDRGEAAEPAGVGAEAGATPSRRHLETAARRIDEVRYERKLNAEWKKVKAVKDPTTLNLPFVRGTGVREVINTKGLRRPGPPRTERGISWVARNLIEDFEVHGATELVGKKVTDMEGLAELAQIYRNPKYETFRFFFMKGDEIIHATGVSARLPASTHVYPTSVTKSDEISWLKSEMSRLGADGYYMLHNHPDGIPTPSDADVNATVHLAGKVPGFRGHVVIDHNKVGVIMVRFGPDGAPEALGGVVDAELNGRDFNKTVREHAMLGGITTLDPEYIGKIGVALRQPGFVTLIGVSNIGVVGIADVHRDALTGPRGRAIVRRFAKQSAAIDTVVVASPSDFSRTLPAVKSLIEDGFLFDMVIAKRAPKTGDAEADKARGVTAFSVRENQNIRERSGFGQSFGQTKSTFVKREITKEPTKLTAEVIPSKQLKSGKALSGKSTQDLRAYQSRALSAVFGDAGSEAMLRSLGMDEAAGSVVDGEGGYDGGVAPNVVMSVRSGKADASLLSKMWMYVFRQDSVPFFRADKALDGDATKAQGVNITFAKPLSDSQRREFFDALRANVHDGLGYTQTGPNELVVISFKDENGEPMLSLSDADFHGKISALIDSGSLSAEVSEYGFFGAETEYPWHDWSADPDGVALRDEIAAGGSPALLERVDSWAERFRQFSDGEAGNAPRASLSRGDEGRANLRPARGEEAQGRRAPVERAPSGWSIPAVQPSTPTVSLRAQQPDAVTVVAVRYGHSARDTLSGDSYGKGARGAESRRISQENDPAVRTRLGRRVYFYVQTKSGALPASEPIVRGQHVTRAKLTNIYDGTADSRGLRRQAAGDLNAFERLVMDAGFDGYLSKNFEPSPAVVLLDVGNVEVEHLGTRKEAAALASTASTSAGTDARPTHANMVQVGKALTEKWKTQNVEYHEDASTLPERVREWVHSKGFEDKIEGVYDPETKTIHMVTSNITSLQRFEFVLAAHEVTHSGLRKLLGEERLDPILRQIYETNKSVRDAAEARIQNGASIELATEETLADMADEGTAMKLKGWDRLVAAIKAFFKDLTGHEWSDSDVRTLVAAARATVRENMESPFSVTEGTASSRVAPGTVPAITRAMELIGEDALQARVDAALEKAGDVGSLEQAHITERVARAVVDEHGENGTGRYEALNSQPAPVWYSELAKQVGKAKFDAAPASQWRSWLPNQPGIKQDELQWTGINEWFDLQRGKVAKQQVLDYLREGGVKVEETMLGEAEPPAGWSVPYMSEDGKWVFVGKPSGISYPLQGLGDSAQESIIDAKIQLEHVARVVQKKEPDRAREIFDRADELDPYIEALAGKGPSDTTKFSSYQLPGGSNYRELLLTLPGKPWAGLIQPPESRNSEFRSSHFNTPNILAHVRFNERTDADGKRILFIEEIQSDWAQKGREEGFGSVEQIFEVRNKAGNVESVHSTRAAAQAAIKRAQRRFPRMTPERVTDGWGIKEAISHKGPPSAPFVGKTEAWVGLALKRMIRYAADNGFDGIAWTTGGQQVTRYEQALRKRVDRIEWTKTPEGVHIVGYKGKGSNASGWESTEARGGKVVDTTHAESDLSDVIGKVMADRIKNDPSQSGVIEQDGITIDDKGMGTFYGRIVPNVANDVMKKLGGGRVGELSIPITGAVPRQGRPANEALADLLREDERAKQPGFYLTPAMKEKAQRGLPLFSRQAVGGQGLAAILGQMNGAMRARGNMPDEFKSSRSYTRPATALQALAMDPDSFQFRDSNRRKMEDIAEDMGLGNVAEIKRMGSVDSPLFVIEMKDKKAHIIEFDDANGEKSRTVDISPMKAKVETGEARGYDPGGGVSKTVWIDVSDLTSGAGGKEVYQLVATWAARNGYIFIPDPAGASPKAHYARASNSLSAAARLGTTKFLWPNAPHDAQTYPSWTVPKWVRELDNDWKFVDEPGDDADQHNQRLLVRAALTIAEQQLKGVDLTMYRHLQYDFDSEQYIDDRSGERVPPQDLNRLAIKLIPFGAKKPSSMVKSSPAKQDLAAEERGAAGAGAKATLARAVVLKSLLDLTPADVDALKTQLLSGEKPAKGTPREAFLASTRPDWVKNGTPELQSAASKIDTYAPGKSVKQWVKEATDNWAERATQKIFDAYAPLKRLGRREYVLARMVKSADSTLEATLLYGRPVLGADGAIHGQLDMKGFLGHMQDLQGEHDRFFAWVAGQRSARLLTQGKEHLFDKDEIAALRALNVGTMRDGSSRAQAFAKAAEVLAKYNKAVLDIAEGTGLIDGDARIRWEHDFYVPFYRVDDDMTLSGPSTSVKGLVRQKAFERLKGGKENLGDLLDNTLRNWSHLISASLANQAAVAALQAAERVGIATRTGTGAKGATYAMVNGQQHWYDVSDTAVLDAITSMESASFKGLPMKLMGKFKHYLTLGVTVSPTFRIRNLMRDSISAIAQNDVSYNMMGNVARGYMAMDKKSPVYAEALFNGAVLRFGLLTDGKHAEHAKRLIMDGVPDHTILNSRQKITNATGSMWDWWQETGDKSENANRLARYLQGLDRGESALEASFAARDMMDFSLQGSSTAVRFLTQIVPFMNARLQGMYKLGRSAREDKVRFGIVTGAVALASMALLMAYKDDDEWKKREDWDRDNFWWFRIGDVAYRIPKPFEVGSIGTIAERSLEMLVSDEMSGERFAERMKRMLLDTLALNPTPQLFKPVLDLYANTDSFSGRTIESPGMDRLSKPERYRPSTSGTAKLLGKAGNYTGLSPVQIDHVIRSYFGWLGTHVAMTVDLATEPFMDVPPRPARKLGDVFVVGDFVKDLPSNRSRYVEDFYKQAQTIQETMGDIKRARETGEVDKLRQILVDRGDHFALNGLYSRTMSTMSKIRSRRRAVEESKLSSEVKRERLDQFDAQIAMLAKSAESIRLARKRAAKGSPPPSE